MNRIDSSSVACPEEESIEPDAGATLQWLCIFIHSECSGLAEGHLRVGYKYAENYPGDYPGHSPGDYPGDYPGATLANPSDFDLPIPNIADQVELLLLSLLLSLLLTSFARVGVDGATLFPRLISGTVEKQKKLCLKKWHMAQISRTKQIASIILGSHLPGTLSRWSSIGLSAQRCHCQHHRQ